MSDREIIPLPLYLPPDQWQVVATRTTDPDTSERIFHYELQLNGYCLCESEMAISLRSMTQFQSGEVFAAVHQAAIRALMRGLGPAIADQLRIVRESGAEDAETPDAGAIDARPSG